MSPHRAPRACPQCGTATTARRCPQCFPPWAGSTWRTQPQTPQWRRIKARRLRANPICQQCHTRAATQIDHINNLAAGGALHDYTNTQALCDTCHADKTAREASTARHAPRIYRGHLD